MGVEEGGCERGMVMGFKGCVVCFPYFFCTQLADILHHQDLIGKFTAVVGKKWGIEVVEVDCNGGRGL